MSRACKIGRMNSGAAAVGFAAVFMMVLLGATVSFAETVNYTYDNLQRLTDVQHGDGTTAGYVHDSADNRLQESATPDLPRTRDEEAYHVAIP